MHGVSEPFVSFSQFGVVNCWHLEESSWRRSIERQPWQQITALKAVSCKDPSRYSSSGRKSACDKIFSGFRVPMLFNASQNTSVYRVIKHVHRLSEGFVGNPRRRSMHTFTGVDES